jgi:hypothetical protein
MISDSNLNVNNILVKGKLADRLPFEILLDNKYYKTRLILGKNCSNPSLVLYCTNEILPEKASIETAVVDFSGILQSKCLDSEIDWIDASGDDWMNDLKEYLDCFPWQVMGLHKKVHQTLPLGLLDVGFNSDDGSIDFDSQDEDDPFDFEKTLRELQDIKGIISS